MVESALTIQSVMQEVRGQGQGMENPTCSFQHCDRTNWRALTLVFRSDEVMHQVVMETDKRSREMCTSNWKVHR